MLRRSLVQLLFLTCTVPAGIASVFPISHLTPADWRWLEQTRQNPEIRKLDELPSGVAALCADSNGKLAAAGESWEATDVITDRNRNLPRKRLIWFIENHGRYLVHYESGGWGHGYHLLIADVGGRGAATLVWHAVGSRAYQSYSDALAALNDNQGLNDDPKFAH